MNEKQKVIYKCENCETEFEANQGSRQRYCPVCLAKKLTQPRVRIAKNKGGKKDGRIKNK